MRGLPIGKLAVYEPPFRSKAGPSPRPSAYPERLREALAAGRRGDAVELFMTMVGIPDGATSGMSSSPVWPLLEAIAPTLAYDDSIMGDGSFPPERLAAVATPTLVLSGGASPEALRHAATDVARAVPSARHRVLVSETHDVSPAVLAPGLKEFFR